MSEQQQQARILIAEDEANLRLVLQKELERLGYRVQAAPDGEAALRKLEESDTKKARGGGVQCRFPSNGGCATGTTVPPNLE